MQKTILSLAVIVLILIGQSACKNKGGQAGTDETKILTVDSFLSSPEKWADKDVTISGTVSHVCKHSGKKLFLFGENPDKTVKIKAGGDVPSFDIKLEGTVVEVQGKVVEDERIDEEYLKSWEEEIKAQLKDNEQHSCEAENKNIAGQKGDTVKVEEEEDPFATVKKFRKKLSESGKTYISIYSIECKTLKETVK